MSPLQIIVLLANFLLTFIFPNKTQDSKFKIYWWHTYTEYL